MRSTDWGNLACSVWDSKQCKISKYVHTNTPLQHSWVPAAWCSQIKPYTVVLSHPFRPRSRKVVPKKRVTLQLTQRKKIVDPFTRANSARVYSGCLALSELTQLGEPKCLYDETLAQLGRWRYHPFDQATFFLNNYTVRHRSWKNIKQIHLVWSCS